MGIDILRILPPSDPALRWSFFSRKTWSRPGYREKRTQQCREAHGRGDNRQPRMIQSAWSPEARAKRKKSMQRYFGDPAWRRKVYNARWTPEKRAIHAEKIRQLRLGKPPGVV